MFCILINIDNKDELLYNYGELLIFSSIYDAHYYCTNQYIVKYSIISYEDALDYINM